MGMLKVCPNHPWEAAFRSSVASEMAVSTANSMIIAWNCLEMVKSGLCLTQEESGERGGKKREEQYFMYSAPRW